MYPKNSILQTLFDKYMLELVENGVLEHIENFFNSKATCTDSQEFTGIEIDFVKILFVLLFCGMAAAIVILILEKVLKCQQNKSNKTHQTHVNNIQYEKKTSTNLT